MIKVIKKNGKKEAFNPDKIIKAVNKSAEKISIVLSDEDLDDIIDNVEEMLEDIGEKEIHVKNLHDIVKASLLKVNEKVYKSYAQYRDYKEDFISMVNTTYEKDKSLRYRAERDRSNANTDTTLVSTKRSVIYSTFNEQLYLKFFLTDEERKAQADGYIYIHDKGARRDTLNCCLFRMDEVIKGGFWMGNMWYNEPNSLDVLGDVMGDVIMSAASQQYGGFSVCEVDKIIERYAKKSYDNYIKEYKKIYDEIMKEFNSQNDLHNIDEKAHDYAIKKLEREMEQCIQAWEYKLNTVASSRGDYPFITMSFGLSTTEFGRMFSKALVRVRRNGQGKKGYKKPVLFPKLVFLYDEGLHGEGKVNEDVFEEAITCSMKAMYPDYLSLTGSSTELADDDGTLQIMYKKYGEVITPMGCRSFLSPWWEKGGMKPADENDKPIFAGRANLGVISTNLPMILQKSREENRNFFEVLDYYLEMIRTLHKRTFDYLSEMQASINPLAFCEGGFYGGHLKPHEKIGEVLKTFTLSFGYTALNELQELYNQKSLIEDGEFAIKVLKYINDTVKRFKEEDKLLYAMYATPAENLCGVQARQFKEMYGVIPNVSDREYFSNSFHCHVSEDISGIEKQDYESRFWDYTEGGRIQYCRYYNNYNRRAYIDTVRRAMYKRFYEGVNLDLCYCDDCGAEFLDGDTCPICGSKHITIMDRVCGYLGLRQIKGDSLLNHAKVCEVIDRKSM